MDPLALLKQFRQQLPASTSENVDLREDLLTETRKLMLDLERPDNTVERVGYQLVESVIVNTAIKMGLFRALNHFQSTSIIDLAKACHADPLLVGRILRCLASNGAVHDDGANMYSENAISKTFSEPKNEAAIASCIDFLAPGWLTIPEFLKARKWQNPSSEIDTPIAKAWNQKATTWEILATNPTLDAFMAYMGTFNDGHKDWTDMYPVLERLGRGAEAGPSAVMMVDVGGGLGHQAINAKRRFPELPGRFIVQDLAHAFPPSDRRPSDVEFMEHDFTTPQPVNGARLYYLRYVPHDWPQDFNVRLFSLLRNAMKPGYSRLIVNEWVVPEVGPTRFMTAQDINMLNGGGGMERTEALHRDYLEKAGLKVNKIFHPGDKISESVIEAQVA